ncbi:hypothetical protein HYS79_02765 [Patescibacteria group bacterium]|nr:hypothetical protein [Patescibacteria group bacterium]
MLFFCASALQAQEVNGGKGDQAPLYQPAVNAAGKADRASSVFRKNSSAPAKELMRPGERKYAPIGEHPSFMQA